MVVCQGIQPAFVATPACRASDSVSAAPCSQPGTCTKRCPFAACRLRCWSRILSFIGLAARRPVRLRWPRLVRGQRAGSRRLSSAGCLGPKGPSESHSARGVYILIRNVPYYTKFRNAKLYDEWKENMGVLGLRLSSTGALCTELKDLTDGGLRLVSPVSAKPVSPLRASICSQG